jgi:hypothetical protein
LGLAEPATTLTDYLLAAVGFGLGLRLLARTEGQRSRALWAASLLATAAAAVAGGTSHGFAPRLGDEALAALWRATYGLIGLANLLILAGAVFAASRPAWRPWLLGLLLLRLGAYTVLVLPHRQFRFVVYDYAFTLAALLALAVERVRRRRPGGGWIAAGVLVSLAGALVQHGRLAPHPAFNHNDLFHVLQTVGLCFFYAGGDRLTDHRPS